MVVSIVTVVVSVAVKNYISTIGHRGINTTQFESFYSVCKCIIVDIT